MAEQEVSNRPSRVLMGTGVFAMVWLIARAAVQSITIDEADTYLGFVLPAAPSGWVGHANNHILNSILMRLVTAIFGSSPLTLRTPALIGAAIYITASYFLVRLITKRLLLQWSLFVCLVFSPFVMDYLVAARGYALALAFLNCGITLAVWHKAGRISRDRAAVLISTCMALSASANFSFAIADAVTAFLIALWIVDYKNKSDAWKVAAAMILPGLAIGFFLVVPALISWPQGHFFFGAHSLKETGRNLIKASIYRPNENLLNPMLHPIVVWLGHRLYPLLGMLMLWRGLMLYRDRASAKGGGLALLCIVSLTITLSFHQILKSMYGVLLPLDRTALYVALLFYLLTGTLAAIPLKSWWGQASGKALTVGLTLIAIYSISCLRLTHFKEWRYDSAVNKAYSVLAYYNHNFGLTGASSHWRYVAALNAYREMSGSETLGTVPNGPDPMGQYPPGYMAYVLYYPEDWPYIDREKLKVVYHDQSTETTVAIRPELEKPSPCTNNTVR
jgi:hypothetical protein